MSRLTIDEVKAQVKLLKEQLNEVTDELEELWEDHSSEYDEGHDARMTYIIENARDLVAQSKGEISGEELVADGGWGGQFVEDDDDEDEDEEE
jgi:hypothetical protein